MYVYIGWPKKTFLAHPIWNPLNNNLFNYPISQEIEVQHDITNTLRDYNFPQNLDNSFLKYLFWDYSRTPYWNLIFNVSCVPSVVGFSVNQLEDSQNEPRNFASTKFQSTLTYTMIIITKQIPILMSAHNDCPLFFLKKKNLRYIWSRPITWYTKKIPISLPISVCTYCKNTIGERVRESIIHKWSITYSYHHH